MISAEMVRFLAHDAAKSINDATSAEWQREHNFRRALIYVILMLAEETRALRLERDKNL